MGGGNAKRKDVSSCELHFISCLHLILFYSNDCVSDPGTNAIKTSPSVKMQMDGEVVGFSLPPLAAPAFVTVPLFICSHRHAKLSPRAVVKVN